MNSVKPDLSGNLVAALVRAWADSRGRGLPRSDERSHGSVSPDRAAGKKAARSPHFRAYALTVCSLLGVILAVAVSAADTLKKLAPLPGPSAPALEAAAQALAEGRVEEARDGFTVILGDSSALPFVRGLAGCGLARLAGYSPASAEFEGFWSRFKEVEAVPAFLRYAALRRLAETLPRESGGSGAGLEAKAMRLPDFAKMAMTYHVAPDGDDANDGTKAKPFRTLVRARDAVRTLKQTHGGRVPAGGVLVRVGGGTYRVQQTLALQAQDSGETDAPVVYQAGPGETPVFSGGIRVTNWKPLADVAARGRLAPAVRDRVLVADLKELGVSDYGDATDLRLRPELFVEGVPQTLARWPNEGFVKTGAILGQDTFKVWNSINGCRDGKFRFVEDRPATWLEEPDVRLYGYWFWDWYEEYQKVTRIDAAERSFTLATPYSQYGYRQDQRYYALNVFRELDQPGEWYLDRRQGRAYWLPPDAVDGTKVESVLSVLSAPFVVIQEARRVLLVGLTFQDGRGDGLHIHGGAECLVAGCGVRRLGGDGVVIQGGRHHGVFGCRLETLGCGGVRAAGGDRQKLTPGGHFVENCTVADISRLKRTYTPAVHLDGCGQRVAQNLFERMPSSALRVEGNDHLIELNRIRDVVQESDDQGGLDMFGNPTYRGVVIRWNRWSDIRGGTHNGAAGVRLDDMISGVVVQGNVFERCGAVAFGGVQIHGGKDNWVDGNLFLDCFAGVSFSRWGEKRWLEAIERFLPLAGEPAHVARYPELAQIKSGADVNVIMRNLFVRCGKVFLRDGGTQQTALNASTDQPFDLESVSTKAAGEQTAALRALLFDPIPISLMGPYEHPWRRREGGQPDPSSPTAR